MSTSTRRHDLDWLRVLAVALLVPFHSALIFVLDPNSIVYYKDTVGSTFLKDAAGFVHNWHMPLLFAISGAATALALGRRSGGQYLRERVLRLLVPFAFGVATLVPAMTYVRLLGREGAPSFWQHWTGFFRLDPADLSGLYGSLTPAHLWFVMYLFVFSVVALPLFLWLGSPVGQRVARSAGAFFTLPGALLLAVLPLAIAATPDLMGDKNPLYYLAVFVTGYCLMLDQRVVEALRRQAFLFTAAALVLTVLSYRYPEYLYRDGSASQMLAGLAYQGTRFTWVLAILGLGQIFLKRDSRLLRWASEAAYPFYVLHMPVNTFVAWLLLSLGGSIAWKYASIVVVTFAVTLLAYEVLVRRWNPTRFLFGMRPQPAASKAPRAVTKPA